MKAKAFYCLINSLTLHPNLYHPQNYLANFIFSVIFKITDKGGDKSVEPIWSTGLIMFITHVYRE